jgi:hypothetical protein
MEMPVPTDAHRKLEALVGTWNGEEKIHPSPWDPEGGSARARVDNRLALEGFAVIQDYEQDRGDDKGFRGHGVFQWNPKEACYVMHWWDAWGFPASEFKGNFEGETLIFTKRDPQGTTRATFELGEPGTYRFKLDVSPDGAHWAPFMEGKYRKES